MQEVTLRDEDGEPVVKVTSQHSGAWPNRPPRTGSFPLMNLAEDFGVDYGDVLLLFELALAGLRSLGGFARLEDLPEGRALTWIDAGDRLFKQLGEERAEERAEALGDALRPLAEARAAL